MLTVIFVILSIWIFWKLAKISIKATWGLTKILVTFLFLPILLIGLLICGLIYIALPILLIIGLVSWATSRT